MAVNIGARPSARCAVDSYVGEGRLLCSPDLKTGPLLIDDANVVLGEKDSMLSRLIHDEQLSLFQTSQNTLHRGSVSL